MKGYPYAFHIALDGNGINGLEGMAGVCLFLFDPAGNRYAYKIVWSDGHDSGIYTLEHLRSLCQCPQCTGERPA